MGFLSIAEHPAVTTIKPARRRGAVRITIAVANHEWRTANSARCIRPAVTDSSIDVGSVAVEKTALDETLWVTLPIVDPRPRAASSAHVTVSTIVSTPLVKACAVTVAIANLVKLAVFRALRLARSFASAGTPAFRIGYEGHVAVPPALFVVALALAGAVQRHIGLADPVFRGLADGIAVATVPCTVLMIAVIITDAISYKTVRALRA